MSIHQISEEQNFLLYRFLFMKNEQVLSPRGRLLGTLCIKTQKIIEGKLE